MTRADTLGQEGKRDRVVLGALARRQDSTARPAVNLRLPSWRKLASAAPGRTASLLTLGNALGCIV